MDKNMRLGIIITATNRAGAALGKVEKQLTSLSDRSSKIGSAMIGMGAKTFAVGAGMGYALSKPIKAAMDFESAMADVKKVVNFDSKADFTRFNNQLLTMSRTIPLSAKGLAQITAAGGQLGIAKKDLKDFTLTVAKMSTAFDMSPDIAGDSMAKLMNVYGMGIGQVGSLGDAINHLSDNTAAKASDIVNVLGRIGGTAKTFGLNATQAAAFADAMLAMGRPPQVAATGINAMLVKLGTANKQGKKFQRGLKALGLSSRQMAKMIKKDANGAIMELLERLKGIDKQKRMGILSDMFGMEYSDDISLLVEGLDNYKKALGLVSDKSKYAGSMQREFANRASTTANQIQLLKNATNEAAINIGSVFLPKVSSMAKTLAKSTNAFADWAKNNEGTAELLGDLGAGATAAVAGLGALGMVGGPVLKGAGMIAKGLSKIVGFGKRLTSLAGAVEGLGYAFVVMNEEIARSSSNRIETKHTANDKTPELKAKRNSLKDAIDAAEGNKSPWENFWEKIIMGTDSKPEIDLLKKRQKAIEWKIAKREGYDQLLSHKAIELTPAALRRLEQSLSTPRLDPKTLPKDAQAYSDLMHALHPFHSDISQKYGGYGETKTAADFTQPVNNDLPREVKVAMSGMKRFGTMLAASAAMGVAAHDLSPVIDKLSRVQPSPVIQHIESHKEITSGSTPLKPVDPVSGQKQGQQQPDPTMQKLAGDLGTLSTALPSQYSALSNTVSALANRPEQHTYHVTVTVNEAKSGEDVEGAVRRALESAHYQSQQRTMHDL